MNDKPQPLALRPREAAKALGIGIRLLWQLTKDGRIPCVRVGGSKRQTILYPVSALQTWLARESGEGEPDASDADRVTERTSRNVARYGPNSRQSGGERLPPALDTRN